MDISTIRPGETEAVQVPAQPAVGRFLLVAAAVFVTLIACSWAWAVKGRMWFLDAEYGMWLANQEMSRTCAYGDLIILGDSRAKAGLVPSVIGSKVTNFALGGGTPIEASYIVERILKCPVPPKDVIVSFSAVYFTSVEVYWQRSALYGFLSFEQMEDVRRLSWKLNDDVIYSKSKAKRLFHTLKNLSYAASIPPYYFPAMINAGFFMRKMRNEETLQYTLRNRGHHFFGTAERAEWVVDYMQEFKVSPLLDRYFSQIVSRLIDRGARVWFVGMPLNKKTFDAFGPGVVGSFRAYLEQYAARYDKFRIVGEVIPWRTAESFGDGEHLNPRGAAIWSKGIRAELTRLGVDTGTAPELQ
jgi:hypothetical protein